MLDNFISELSDMPLKEINLIKKDSHAGKKSSKSIAYKKYIFFILSLVLNLWKCEQLNFNKDNFFARTTPTPFVKYLAFDND